MQLQIQLLLMAAIGGIVFAVTMHQILPFFGTPPVRIRSTMYIMATISFLFWSSFVLPTALIVAVSGQDGWISVMRSVSFFAFMGIVMLVTFLIGKRNGME